MFAQNNRAPRRALVAMILASACAGLFAQAAGSADPISIWDHTANAAGWGIFPDALAVGVRAEAAVDDLAGYEGGDLPGSLELAYGVPGFLYRYSDDGTSSVHEMTNAFGVRGLVAMGVRFRWNEANAGDPPWGRQDIGIIARPASFVSVSMGMDDAFDVAGDGFSGVDLGLAVRPLAFSPAMESMLTLSADAGYYQEGFRLGGFGARFMLDDWLSVHGRYGFAPSGGDATVSIGVSAALSGMETSLAYGATATQASIAGGDASLGQSIRVGRTVRSADRLFGTSVLLIDEPGFVATTPPLFDMDTGLIDPELWSEQVLAAIDRAATDRSISALVLVEPPLFESDARAQEFGRSLARFRKTGKPVYVYATSMDRLSYVYAASGAELVALDPNGTLALVDVASFSFYLKGLLARLGIDVYNLQSHDTKTAYNMFSESSMTDAERDMKRRFVAGLAGQAYAFLDSSRSAKLKGSAASTIGAGPYLDPREAVAQGLIDELMYRDEFDERIDELTGGAPLVDARGYARERGLSWGTPLGKQVAVVYLTGSIIEGDGVAGSSIGDDSADFLASLRDDTTIAGVILRVDSGGGSALTSDHIAREVAKLRDAGKPVVVSMASYAASGGYYISANADRIIAEEGTITGSIGVTGLDLNMTRLLEKLDASADIVSAGESGAFGNPFLPRREGDAKDLAGYIDYVYNRFVDVVASGRKMDRARVDELGKGQIWLGSEAVANGLIDATGGLDDAKAAMESLLESRVRYTDYMPGSFDADMLLGLLGSSVRSVLDAASTVAELRAMGTGPLYLAPEYLYQRLR